MSGPLSNGQSGRGPHTQRFGHFRLRSKHQPRLDSSMNASRRHFRHSNARSGSIAGPHELRLASSTIDATRPPESGHRPPTPYLTPLRCEAAGRRRRSAAAGVDHEGLQPHGNWLPMPDGSTSARRNGGGASQSHEQQPGAAKSCAATATALLGQRARNRRNPEDEASQRKFRRRSVVLIPGVKAKGETC
jgi:hypothetical protein